MNIIQVNGRVFGAKLTSREKDALVIETKKLVAEYTQQHHRDIDATFLYVLHKVLGFGPKKLKQVYMGYMPMIRDLCKRYEMNEDGDDVYLCTKVLEEIGVDLDEWEKEVEANL